MEMTRDRADPKSSGAFVCEKCGAQVFAAAATRYCPACLLESGLNLLERDESVTQDEPVLAEFGDYELLEEIGRGGQGIVYRARQKSLNRLVALKIIGLGHRASETHLKRFRREAEAAASLQHPRIIPIYEIGERDGACYFSMKLEEGGQLDQFVRRGAISLRRAAEIIANLARTVHYAHEHGILHRDIKPGNILLDASGEPHLADFGLVRLVESDSTVTRTMEVLGTPSYIAPEQAAGQNEQVTSTTDVYGLGAVFYQLLTGHPPFAGGTTYETIRLVLETEPRSPRLWNPKVDRDLTTICLKCLEKDPSRRFKSALELAEDLERWLKHEPIHARRTGPIARSGKWIRRNTTMAALAASLVALAIASGWIIWKSELIRNPRTTGIAVLPFENLSDEKEHAFFADGVQDDILTKLAKIADLKVISRTSVMQYRGKQDVRKIANALRVSHVLEGTVRRSGSKLHVNAQLVDARTDQDIWADEYDRDLSDVFAIETEVAQSIANRLRTTLSARELAAIQERPTRTLAAYDFYVQATSLINTANYELGEQQKTGYLRAVELLNQATARDSHFFRAYCRLAEAHDELAFHEEDVKTDLTLAKSAIDTAFRLKPDAGEAHLALALHFYHGYLDHDKAHRELALARRTLPNDARVFYWSGLIDRRQGRWDDAARDLERAMELDPRNVNVLIAVGWTGELMRNYARAKVAADRLIALEPSNSQRREWRAWIDFGERGDTRALHAYYQMLGRPNFYLSLYERNTSDAHQALTALEEIASETQTYLVRRIDGYNVGGAFFDKNVMEGLVARIKGDATAAQKAFEAARAFYGKEHRDDPGYGPSLCILAMIDAALGRNQEALQEGRRALELSPLTKDSFDGADVLYFYAVTCAWAGERDLALEQLQKLAKTPGGLTYGDALFSLYWDSLRGDPRFEKIVASLAPTVSHK
ncbi:MAG: protein kinase [Candidatus Acidiferrum sp.]